MNSLIVVSLICLAVVLTGCSEDSATSGSSQQGADGSASNGEMIFESRCASCHSPGVDRRYGPGLAGLFSSDDDNSLPNGEPITEASVANWIRSGGEGDIGVMPPQSLNDHQLRDVIAYLKTLHIP